MTSHSWLFANDAQFHRATRLTIEKRAEEIAAEISARAEKRRLAFEALKSTLSSPADRIRAWEKLYGLRLPSDSNHTILFAVAQRTGLSLAEVQAEQRSRKEQRGMERTPPVVVR